MKKYLCVIMAMIIVFSLCSCKQQEEKQSVSSGLTQSEKTNPNIPIIDKISKTEYNLNEQDAAVLELARSFAKIPTGYANGTKLGGDFLGRTDFEEVSPLEIALFVSELMDETAKAEYKALGYDGYVIPTKYLNKIAGDIFFYTYNYSKIVSTDGTSQSFRYMPEKKAVGIHSWENGPKTSKYEFCSFERLNDGEFGATYNLYLLTDKKPEGAEGREWFSENGVYYKYDRTAFLVIRFHAGKWRYMSFTEKVTK